MKREFIKITEREAVNYEYIGGAVGVDNPSKAYKTLEKWMKVMGEGELLQSARYYTLETDTALNEYGEIGCNLMRISPERPITTCSLYKRKEIH